MLREVIRLLPISFDFGSSVTFVLLMNDTSIAKICARENFELRPQIVPVLVHSSICQIRSQPFFGHFQRHIFLLGVRLEPIPLDFSDVEVFC